MNRREFVRDVLLWSAGLSLGAPRFNIAHGAAVPAPAPVAVASGKDYRLLVEKAIETLGGMKNFIKSGDKVVIKPNIGWDRTPELGANTHPLVVRTLAVLALDAGAATVQVFDHTCNEKRRCYANSGIIDELEKLGDKRIRCEHIDPRKFVPVDIARGLSLKRWEIYRDALTADCYINVPVAKHHGLSRLSLGLKNAMGVIGGNRGKLHQNLGQDLADLATVVLPKLTVIDATRILLRNGPQGGRVEDVKVADTVIVTTDPVAADAYATTLFGMQPEEIDSTVAAARMGLGEIDVRRMQLRIVQV